MKIIYLANEWKTKFNNIDPTTLESNYEGDDGDVFVGNIIRFTMGSWDAVVQVDDETMIAVMDNWGNNIDLFTAYWVEIVDCVDQLFAVDLSETQYSATPDLGIEVSKDGHVFLGS